MSHACILRTSTPVAALAASMLACSILVVQFLIPLAQAAPAPPLLPAIRAAARPRATEGEMIAAMQEVFGTYTESPVF